MRRICLVLAVFAVAVSAADETPFVLNSPDFRWIPVRIRQTPVEVDVNFSVSQGNAMVHAELIEDDQFRALRRGEEHESLAMSAEGTKGGFRRIVEEPGNYRVVIMNRPHTEPGLVTLSISTRVDGLTRATELPLKRRMATIGVSLGLFLAMLGFCGYKLRKAASREEPPPFTDLPDSDDDRY